MNKKIIFHSEIKKRCQDLAAVISRQNPICKIYPVPRGGIPIAYHLLNYLPQCEITESFSEADIIVDDLIDSGRTRERYKDKPFYALYNKQEEPDLGWLVFPWEVSEVGSAEDIIIRNLQFIGEDSEREGLLETPKRVIKSWGELYKGYSQKPEDVFKHFDSDGYNQIVLLKDIEMYSMCEHHMLPFIGKAHIAYIPNGKVIGISKLARLLDIYARRLQIQERIGEQVTNDLMNYLQPLGACCIIEAHHLCMRMRGVSKQHSTMVTSSMKGVFLENNAARTELMSLIKG